MEELWKILGVTKGLTAVIGSGGKTSLLYELAEELRPCGTVLLATTTHIMRPPQYPFVQTPEELAAALAGPAANLAAAWLCCRAEGGALFAGLNLALGCFNLLPVGRLDGGRALHCLLSMSIGPAAEEAEAVLDRVLIAFLLALAQHRGNFGQKARHHLRLHPQQNILCLCGGLAV